MSTTPTLPPEGIARLLAIMATLRDPVAGCPWDVKQDFDSIAPYTLEEAHEVAEAIARRDWKGLCEELGDLLLQVVFHARMAEEAGHFGFDEVVAGISDKMVRRHPHVFGDETGLKISAEEQTRRWAEQKAAERAAAGAQSLIDTVKNGQPPLARAVALQQTAARIGFDWPDTEPVYAKLAEEVDELRAAQAEGADPHKLADELGDVLFVVANLARHLGIDPAQALTMTNAKFERRFRRMEALAAAEGVTLEGLDLASQDHYWDRAKAEDHAGQL
jgi:ATP diphosphatase